MNLSTNNHSIPKHNLLVDGGISFNFVNMSAVFSMFSSIFPFLVMIGANEKYMHSFRAIFIPCLYFSSISLIIFSPSKISFPLIS